MEPVSSTLGRKHIYLRERALEEAVSFVQAGVMPLVWEHLIRAPAAAAGKKAYVSEVQLLVTDPCAADQYWHIDNRSHGLTLVVPLTTVPANLGASLFIPGSHHLFQTDQGRVTRWKSFLSSVLGSDGPLVTPMLAGDALLYDSRCIHRGTVNRRYDRSSVALVFRYDYERPPGLGMFMAQFLSWSGNTLSVLHRFYSLLPTGQS